ncbi:MAG: hypothetical protein WHS89_03755 [Acidimicrobiales bacterium]
MRDERDHKRFWRDVGASAAEYALIFAVLVAGTVGAFEQVSKATRSEVNNQADCVSTRPPPPSCNFRESRPTTTTTAPPPTTVPPTVTVTSSTTTTTAPPTTTTTVPPANGSWASSSSGWVSPPVWYGQGIIQLTAGSTPVAGAHVIGIVRLLNPPTGQQFAVECVTDAAGRCVLRYDVSYTDVTRIELSVLSVESSYPSGSLPAALEFSKP